MDAGSLALMIPIVALISAAAVKIAKVRVAAGGLGDSADEIHRRLDAMEQEQAALRQEMVESQERLDFAERLLAQHQDKPLPPPS